ncbi:aminopeptidase [Oceanirhabdus sp. W0125-5]|uniref:aminopeptidase n=1 Tax=Oceanirhabdus sp. W0125-5 TaxID=2999116 RepID=UPI0022F3310B|nr:aminopeptidase [Oceanirhabdus sp. W0125-5]WBW97529.1 aminopeptidase [Oceanirhabdus sp. W0125-5]
MNNFNELLQKYAKLAVKTGVNIQENQTLVINAPITAKDFVRAIAKEAYSSGVIDVHVDWNDEEISLIKFNYANDNVFDHFPDWKATSKESLANEGAAFLSISASNPDLLKNVDPKKIARTRKAQGKAMEGFKTILNKGNVRWSIVSIPTDEWAMKVFPNLNKDDAVKKLWENIFTVTRVDSDDPVKAWDNHINLIKCKTDLLNKKQFKSLHFKSTGTDLVIDLPKDHIWVGGGLTDHKDIYYIPNMPTEEIFTTPLKTGVNGVVSSTKPLNYGGNLIENFTLTFKDGRVVDYSAEKGYEILKGLIETDEGSHYIGEVALVPDNSPISNTGLIFYNTLFDENASCHLAIGSSYPICIKDGTTMNKQQLEEHGLNTSITHVDFMIGSKELSIEGITESGERMPIFTNGNWSK